MSDPLDQAKATAGILADLKNIAGDNPDVKAGALEAAKSFRTATTFINNALLPLVAVNWTIQKAKDFFQGGQFEEELRPKISDIPWESIIEPKASVAGPAMQGLSFSLDEPALKDMYLNLLAKSMDGRHSEQAHPSFVEIIKQITSLEAKLLESLLVPGRIQPMVQLRQAVKVGGYQKTIHHICSITSTGISESITFATYIDNWVRLGLVYVSYDEQLLAPGSYDWVQARPEYDKYKKEFDTDETKLEVVKGFVAATSLGLKFGEVVGIYTPASTRAVS